MGTVELTGLEMTRMWAWGGDAGDGGGEVADDGGVGLRGGMGGLRDVLVCGTLYQAKRRTLNRSSRVIFIHRKQDGVRRMSVNVAIERTYTRLFEDASIIV